VLELRILPRYFYRLNVGNVNADLNRLTGSDCERWPLLNGTTVTRHRTDPGRQENLIPLTNASSTAAADSRT